METTRKIVKSLVTGVVLVVLLATAGLVFAGNGLQAQEDGAMFRLVDFAPNMLDDDLNQIGTAEREWSGEMCQYTYILDTIEVPADSPEGPTYSNVVLEEGRTYILRASGTADAGDSIDFDAKYSYKDGCSSEWTDCVCNYEDYGETLLDLQVNGSTPEWGEYSPIHVYTAEIVGTGNHIGFEIYDTYPSNNVGNLTVEIYRHGQPVEVGPGVFYLGESFDDEGRVIERYDFVHYAKDPDKVKESAWDEEADLYKLMFGGIKWFKEMRYEINTMDTPENLNLEDVEVVLQESLETWNSAIGDSSAQFGLTDGTSGHVISWANLTEIYGAKVIAVNSFSFYPMTKEMIDSDVTFSTDFAWSISEVCEDDKMDLQSIATHEFGHNGLNDLYMPIGVEQTMYGYGGFGETHAQTLEIGDISGIKALYGK